MSHCSTAKSHSSHTHTIFSGLFPPQTAEIWEHDLPWQPVPVHTVPRLQDKVLAINFFYFSILQQLYEDIPCPIADDETRNIYGSEEVRKIEAENKNFLEMLALKTNSTDTGLGAMWRVYDQLNCQVRLTVPFLFSQGWRNGSRSDRMAFILFGKRYDRSVTIFQPSRIKT